MSNSSESHKEIQKSYVTCTICEKEFVHKERVVVLEVPDNAIDAHRHMLGISFSSIGRNSEFQVHMLVECQEHGFHLAPH